MAGNEASSLTRRSFLKATAMTAGAAAVMGTAGCTTIAEQAEEDAVKAVEEKTYTNWCRGNCGGPCNLTGVVREGKLVKTSPTPVPKGAEYMRRGCVRSHSGPQRIYGKNRVLYPMLQKGERGSDNWERISWDEACALVADNFNAIIDEFGPEAIAVASGCGNATGIINGSNARYTIDAAFGGVAGGRFYSKLGLTHLLYSSDANSMWMTQMLLQQPSNSVEDILNAKTVFLWGTNPAESGTVAWPYLCKARENGTKVVTIDPQFSKSAAGSDVWVPVRPGTDGALVLAMCNYIIENDLVDWDYFKNHSVAPLLVKEDGTYLRLSDLGMDPVPVVDSSGKEVPTDTEVVYDEATDTFGSSFELKDPAIRGTFEANGMKVRPVFEVIQEFIEPFTVEFAVEECGIPAELIAKIAEMYAVDKPAKLLTFCGSGHLTNTWRNYMDNGFLAALTGNAVGKGGGYGQLGMLLFGSQYLKSPLTRGKSAYEVEGGKPCYGMTMEFLPQILETGTWNGKDYPIKSLFVVGDNILGSQMGPTYMKKAFEKIDFIVVADPLMTYTSRYADLLLPITLSWEDVDHNGQFMMQRAVEPLGEARSDFAMFKGIAEAMGFTDLYTKSPEEYLRDVLDTPENIEAGVAFDDYNEQGAIFTDYEPGEILGAETNPTGRTQFYLQQMTPNNDYGQEFTLADRVPYYERANEAYKDNPLREKYPLFALNGYHNHYFGQTFLSHIPWLDDLRGYEGEPYMVIHPKAAEERGIEMGDTVRVHNDHGYVVCRAVVSTGLREDTVRLPHGYAYDQYIEGNPQDLVPLSLDLVSANNNYNDFLCEVEKM